MKKALLLLGTLLELGWQSQAQTLTPTPYIRAGGTADNLTGGYTFAYATSGTPWNGALLSFGGFANNYDCQLSTDYGPNGGGHVSFRTRNGDAGVWNGWREIWNSGNLNNSVTDFVARNISTSGRLYLAGTDTYHYLYSSGTSGNNMYFGEYLAGGNQGFHWVNSNGNTDVMILDGSGNLGIATSNTQGYKLAVNGSAIATSMSVKLYSEWPDYVFKPTYKLPSLIEVKNYIDVNQHLPDMPSEAEVAKEGINLGEMNKLLTKKLEELTLYAIEQKEEIEQLKKGQEEMKAALAKVTASK